MVRSRKKEVVAWVVFVTTTVYLPGAKLLAIVNTAFIVVPLEVLPDICIWLPAVVVRVGLVPKPLPLMTTGTIVP